MPKYKVRIKRIEVLVNDFYVEANDRFDAVEKAEDLSSDYAWSSEDYVRGEDEIASVKLEGNPETL